MRRLVTPLLAALLLSAASLPALADGASVPTVTPATGRPSNGSNVMTAQTSPGPEIKVPGPSDATTAYREAGTRLQLDMGIRYTNDADKDFAALMAAYTKAMIATARIEIANGTDPAMRALAQRIVEASQSDAAAVDDWRGKHP